MRLFDRRGLRVIWFVAVVGSLAFFGTASWNGACREGTSRRAEPWSRQSDAEAAHEVPRISDRALKPTIAAVFAPEEAQIDLLLSRLQPGQETDLGVLLHALWLFGPACVVDHPTTGTHRVLDLLLNSDRGHEYFGSARALCKTRYGAAFPQHEPDLMGTEQPSVEGHPGQTLSILAGLGVPLSQTVILPGGESSTLRAVFTDVTANFVLEGEIYWDAVAVALYTPQAGSWSNKFGVTFTCDQVTDEILRRPPGESACAGIHRLIALTILMRVDAELEMLSPDVRERVRDHLGRVASMLTQIQHSNGAWQADWYQFLSSSELAAGRSPGPAAGSILATGHHLEWLMLLPDEIRPPNRVFALAAEWLLASLLQETRDEKWTAQWYCPASHGARVIRILAERPAVSAVRDDNSAGATTGQPGIPSSNLIRPLSVQHKPTGKEE